jgi:hypothetical protein
VKVDAARKRSRGAILERRSAEFLRNAAASLAEVKDAKLELLSPPSQALWRSVFQWCSELLDEASHLGEGTEAKWIACGELDRAAGRIGACAGAPEDWCIGFLGEAIYLVGYVKGKIVQAQHERAKAARGGKTERRAPEGRESAAAQARAMKAADPTLSTYQIGAALGMDTSNVAKALRVRPVAR